MSQSPDLERLEQYLQSKDERYYVSDNYTESSRMIIIEPYPGAVDIKDKSPSAAFKTPSGIDLFNTADPMPETVKGNMNSVGVMYLSNVPLYPMEGTFDLAGPLEGVRLAPKPVSEHLQARFAERFTELILNDSVKLIAYKLELVKRYYDDFVEHADEKTRARLDARLENGSLKILMFPFYPKSYLDRNMELYGNFKSALNEIF